MSIRITITPGHTFSADAPVTIAALNALLSNAYAVIDGGSVGTTYLVDGAVTAGKLAATLDLSAKTVTLPAALMPRTSVAEAPDFVGQWAVVGDALYRAKGTASAADWFREDVLSSVAEAPPRVGAWALVGGALWYGAGTASPDDWLQLASEWQRHLKQAANPDGEADVVTVFCKETGGSLDLWFRRGLGEPVQLTGVVGTALAGALSPDWDSGWCAVKGGEIYDLSGESMAGSPSIYGGFSSTLKGGDGSTEKNYGVTAASGHFASTFMPSEDHWGYRLMQARLRRIWDGASPPSEYHDQMVVPLHQIYQASYYTGVHLWWDNGTGILKLKAQPMIWMSAAVGDLPANWVSTALVRLQAWK